MDLELRHLRCLVAVVDTGSFTDAGVQLGVSQAAVSRTVSALEQVLGVRVLHRTSRTVSPTTAGVRVLARARVLLEGADELVRAASGDTHLRIGHAWSALGAHTAQFQRRWHTSHPAVEVHLIRHNTPTAGLAEGLCDVAIIRSSVDLNRWSHALVGHEPRYAAMSTEDPLARRRSLLLADLADRTVAIDHRTGTTTPDLWPAEARPTLEHTQDVDDWLAAIAFHHRVGVTPASTAHQYRREGVTYRRLKDAPPVPVRLVWNPHAPHPATHAAVALLQELYQQKPG